MNSHIVRFCAIECRLQMSGEESVAWMYDAWLYAQARAESSPPTLDDIRLLGEIVEPVKNHAGFRSAVKANVRVGASVKIPYEKVDRHMDRLVNELMPSGMTPAEFFREYEEIHPFVDGNGRTGVILYNWLNRTLDEPVWAPNFWNDPRRVEGYGAPFTSVSQSGDAQ